ncbi:uncharacterized protein LOC141884480 [Acropora palmata]|uniref:uncharacterized protein LOC141884480 n=1 Tax=Acropora palmata TaxID=6131 RepID=UPI003DA0E8D4
MPLVEQSESGDRCSFRLRRIGTAATFPGISDTFKINKEITIVGRNPASSDIFLDSNQNKVMISRLHARIISEKDEVGKHSFRISDTSLNGTFVNDVKITDSCDLYPGDTVTFGHLKGAVLNPGIFAEQPDSEFRFAFEKYPTTPPEKGRKLLADKSSSSPEFQKKTQRHTSPETGPKTPLLSFAALPELSALVTPGTPVHGTECSSTHENTRLPDSMHGKHNWRQHFVSDSSDSEHSDNDLVAYASAAVVAMEESDDDIFSIQLPESPKCLTDVHSHTKQTEALHIISGEAKSYAQGKNKSNCKRFKSAKGGDCSRVKIAKKRPRKSSLGTRRRTAQRKSSRRRNAMADQEEDDQLLYDTCASVDCVHPHNNQKVVDWVQCDDCDAWYHVICTGLTLRSVQPKTALFHCGCA